ncbi:hypothetical protein FHT39_000314 [Mitsuaria sp. BK045]|nr:hypothetical protein [Mitsuaria sp. BK041]MBB3360892.1 hypothetical protein [Mitsuaria sp. BK045]
MEGAEYLKTYTENLAQRHNPCEHELGRADRPS